MKRLLIFIGITLLILGGVILFLEPNYKNGWGVLSLFALKIFGASIFYVGYKLVNSDYKY